MNERQETTLDDLRAARIRRRDASPYSNYFHRAVRVRDMEATRHFYEDLMHLPLVACEVMEVAHGTGEETNYIHTFFELGDGSCLAFFQFADDRHPYVERTPSHFDHHAISAKSEETVIDAIATAQRLGLFHVDVDDERCHSVYIRDPDGDLFEIAYPRPASADTVEADAHQTLSEWLAEYGDRQRVVPRPKKG